MAVDLIEDLLAGIEANYPTPAERYKAMLEYAEGFKDDRREVASYLRNKVKREREECLAAGVCPYCGEDVAETTSTEDHGDTRLGHGRERLQQYVCPKCGEV